MATDTVGEEFITIVPVGESQPVIARDPSFVTVLTVGSASGAAEIVVRRPRGARLGLGLKFEGGSAATENVRRLLVQSCAEDSPAANTSTPWGKLIPGDEILAIDNTSVSDLTRIECVRRLKDSDETLRLLVRHFESNEETARNVRMNDLDVTVKQTTEIVRPTTLPPPVPPRKLGKKNSFKDKQSLLGVSEQNVPNNSDGVSIDKESALNGHNGITNTTKLSRKFSFDSHTFHQNKESISSLKKGSPEEVRRLVRRLSDGKTVPPDAEVYIDLLSSEWERCLALADIESDDTGSSISTVVDRFGSITSSVENSIPSTPIMQPKTIDIQKVLNCIENIDSSILNDINKNTFLEQKTDTKIESVRIGDKTKVTNGVISHDYNTKQKTSTIVVSEKNQGNDKNNNNSTDRNVKSGKTVTEVKNQLNLEDQLDSIIDLTIEKPKPMPRNTKNERTATEKAKSTTSPQMPLPVSESLLTPSKKNCIETWLQHSEAEMNSNVVEKSDKTIVPEVLPRLIDFVPKPQFKECRNEATNVVRPTTAPPPPPVDTREDGSGASLDTIGELDESSDVTDNTKPTTKDTSKRKASYERNFWEDRVNKSDAEDKSLSNDETPMPTCPRQPPDGVETPSDVVEKVPDLPSRLPPKLSVGRSNTRSRYSYSSRSQDARSEASVKDKIAMFSNDHSTSSDRLEKCGTLPARNSLAARKSIGTYSSSYSEVSTLDRRLTKSQDNLDDTLFISKKRSERPEVMGAVGALENGTMESNYSVGKNSKNFHVEASTRKPLFYGSTNTITSTMETFAPPVYHVRSVSDDSGCKNVHKSNLEYLIEQRKKSMSKLRGLVIPEVQGPIIDLPEIKVQDTLSKSFLIKTSQNNTKSNENKNFNLKPLNLNENKWKSNLLSNNVPKYSPAFKRKSLQVYTASTLSNGTSPMRKYSEILDTSSKINSKYDISKLTRSSGINNSIECVTPNSQVTKLTNTVSNNFKNMTNDARDFKNVEIRICTVTDIVDSDNDSAMSSTQSSYRSSASSPLHNLDSIESDNSRISPRISHYSSYSHIKPETILKNMVTGKNCDQYIKRNICRSMSSDTNVSLSSSVGSAATSGSQASCSSLESSVADTDKVKSSKSYSIDTINRRNILASAKCRSGRDDKLKSPVVETKFVHESHDNTQNITNTSDRLSTLTSSVSALSIKGDNRRRNKKVAESETDSDSDNNLRQRKSDYKNTRLKRNSSNSNKNKNNDSSVDINKLDDAPKIISEKIMKELKKPSLDNFDRNNVTKKKERDNNDNCKVENSAKREETKTSNEISQNQNNSAEIISQNGAYENKTTTKMKNDSNSNEKNNYDTQIIRLKRGAGTGVGLILAGGIDCEAKDVTVHRVLEDSIAAKAGLKRGAKVISVNGCSMTGLTHAQSVSILKEQRSEVVIEIENETQNNNANGVRCGSENAESKVRKVKENENMKNSAAAVVTVCLDKAGGGAGLGFGLDGGRDSPNGDRPLTIKKLFAGGAAAQSGRILVGAELLSAGGQSMEGFTRTQAWAALKALPVGPVALVLKNPI